MILRFGKFKGWHVEEVPLSYLAWIFESLTGKPEIREAALDEIRRRVSGYELEAEPLSMGGGRGFIGRWQWNITRTGTAATGKS